MVMIISALLIYLSQQCVLLGIIIVRSIQIQMMYHMAFSFHLAIMVGMQFIIFIILKCNLQCTFNIALVIFIEWIVFSLQGLRIKMVTR